MSSTPGLPRDWIPTLMRLLERQPMVARVVVTEARGSTPREPGAFMLVGHNCVEGSIGGGRLEWEAIAAARDLLADPAVLARTNKVVLAADVGQCCGGVVSFWLEKFTRDDLANLRAAAEAGARGAAVLVSELSAGVFRRRIVREDTHQRTPQTAAAGVASRVASSAAKLGAAASGDTARPAVSSGEAARVADGRPRQPSGAAADAFAAASDSIAPFAAKSVAVAQAAGPVTTTVPTGFASAATVSSATAPSATAHAVDQLLREPRQHASPLVLAPTPNTLTFLERLDDNLPAVWLYGAGHVGQALARILSELPLRLTWIDSRAELFPQTLPDGVRVLQDPDPMATVHEAPVGAYFIVMSHSHPLDFDLCHALLERNDFAWLGLIGSASKAARFRSRLARAGLDREVIGKLVCPIGVEGITSKWPAAIAVAVAAQLMQRISVAAEDQPGTLSTGVARAPGAELARQADFAQPPGSQTRQSNTEASGEADTSRAADTSHVASVAGSPSVGAPCAPELCATCGTPMAPEHFAADPDALSSDTDSASNNSTPDPRHDTVPT